MTNDSFVDLLADDVWTEADIARRAEAMVRSEFAPEVETLLQRKVLGISLGTYQPTAEDAADLARFEQVTRASQMAASTSRADMALLARVFPMEEAQRRLDRLSLTAAWDRLQQPVVEPVLDETTGEPTNAEALAQDEAERSVATTAVMRHLIEGAEGPALDPAAVIQDEAERAEAAAVIAAADAEAAELFDQRRAARRAAS